MAFYDYREPIEYVVDRYFEKKRFLNANSTEGETTSLHGAGSPYDNLPDIPCKIIYNGDGDAVKFIYGEIDALTSGADEYNPVIWQQELVRNAEGQVEKIIVTYPDGETVTEALVRDAEGTVNEYKLE